MGWETRGNHSYYYLKRRDGGRVISKYVGAGPFVGALARLERLDRERRTLERQAEQEALEADRALDRQVDQVTAAVRDMTKAVLVASGYRTHHGTWRKQRQNHGNET